MSVPFESYKPLLTEETLAIAFQKRDAIEFVPVLYMHEDNIRDREHVLVRAINVHMVPGEASPRLRKVEVPNSGIPEAIDSEVVAGCTNYLRHKKIAVPDYAVGQMPPALTKICAELEESSGVVTAPFNTVGVLGMYVTALRKPLVGGYLSSAFLLDLAARIPDEIVTATETEAAAADAIEDVRGHMAVGWLGMLLQPRELTHPTVQAALF